MIGKSVTNYFILNSLSLPKIDSFKKFYQLLGISGKLLYILNKNTEKNYSTHIISKKNGTHRIIHKPNYTLKMIQKWILVEILEKIKTTEEAMAFKKTKDFGTKANATKHKFNLYLLEMDLKDFFPSITAKKVFFLFKNIGYNNTVSSILTNLCTVNDKLPQGAVTSPYISNLVCYSLDNKLKKICDKREIIYTRYADDLTFSCNNKKSLIKLKEIIEHVVNKEGFKVNESKTRFLSPSGRKSVTGIIINDELVKAPKNMKRKVRSLIFEAISMGNYDKIDKIKGYISYISSIEKEYNYETRIKKYICKVGEKTTIDKILMHKYNENRKLFFKDLDEVSFNEEHFEILNYYDFDKDNINNYSKNFLGEIDENLCKRYFLKKLKT